jgi:hypothetical protein
MYVRMTITLNAPNKPGTQYTLKLFTKPRSLYRKKVGIRPALMYIVNRKYTVVNLFIMYSLRLSTYAAIEHMNIPHAVLSNVRATELRKAIGSEALLNTCS